MKKTIALIAIAAFPMIAFAQGTVIQDVNGLARKATGFGNLFIELAISFAVVWIIGSVVWYLVKGGADEEARKKEGQAILYGVIGLFVILSIWGLVFILTNTFKTNNNRPDLKQSNVVLPAPDVVP